MRQFSLLFLLLILFCSGCKSPPPPVEMPRSVLVFDHIEAANIHQIELFFLLKVENTREIPLNLEIQNWKTTINGVEADHETAVLLVEGGGPLLPRLEAEPGAVLEKNISLRLNLGDAADDNLAAEFPDDNYMVELTLELSYRYGTAKAFNSETSATAVFPRIRAPEFTITAIAIMQAELINTRFRVSLQIDNPNPFPLTLSSFSYELYGEGLFWANGRERDLLLIPAKGSAETRLTFLMNFINMRRRLLDEIIAMRMVSYRFTGEAEVGTDIPWLPRFNIKFNRSGYSEVLK
jgi:LEA14-like dessication related protein